MSLLLRDSRSILSATAARSINRGYIRTTGGGIERKNSLLTSFLDAVDSHDDSLVATHRGLRYELQVGDTLQEKGLELVHTGKAADGGVDLRGKWNFPDGYAVRVVIQCKSSGKRLGPKYIRELEGSLSREPPQTVGLLVSPIGYTPQAVKHINTTPFPLALLQVGEGGGLNEFQANSHFLRLVPRLIVGAGLERHMGQRSMQLLYNIDGDVRRL